MKSTPKSNDMLGLICENLFRHVFGDKKYYGYATAFNNPTFRRREFKKLINKFVKHVDELNASEKFKEYLTYQLKYLQKEIARTSLDPEAVGILVINLKIISTFLGYHYASGNKREEPYFIPSIWAEKRGWVETLEYYTERDKLIERREKIVELLQQEGLSLSEIAFILNISGYKVSQISQKIKLKNKK